jgi:hypothetical protein
MTEKCHECKLEHILMQHTSEEMERYTEIMNKIDDNDASSINRHHETQSRIDALSQSINAFISSNQEFMNGVRKAFPRDDDGSPDFTGHRNAHQNWIANDKRQEDLMTYVKKTVLGAAATAVAGFIVVATWAAFVRGPMP